MSILDEKEPRRIGQKEMKEVKMELMKRQNFICPLCKKKLLAKDLAKVALDHCHDTGYIRGVLHMRCNRAEGAVKTALRTWCGAPDTPKGTLKTIENLKEYLAKSVEQPILLIYPKHKTKQELAVAAAKKALKHQQGK